MRYCSFYNLDIEKKIQNSFFYFSSLFCRVHGVCVSDNANYYYDHIDELINDYDLKDVKARDICDIIDGYKGLGYAKSTNEELGMSFVDSLHGPSYHDNNSSTFCILFVELDVHRSISNKKYEHVISLSLFLFIALTWPNKYVVFERLSEIF